MLWDAQGDTCWFKGRISPQRDLTDNAGCVSGIVRENPAEEKASRRRRSGYTPRPASPIPPPPPYAVFLWLGPCVGPLALSPPGLSSLGLELLLNTV